MLFDIVQEIPIAELYTDKDTNDNVYKFINKNTKPHERIGIITDLKPGYDKVMAKLKFQRHQYCIFHLKLNINQKIQTELSKLKRNYITKIKKEYNNPSKKIHRRRSRKTTKRR